SPKTTSHNRYPIFVYNALMNQPGHTINHIGLYLSSPFFKAGRPKLLSIARRPSIIQLKNEIAPIRQKLYFGIKSAFLPTVGSVMHKYDHRQLLSTSRLRIG